MNELFIQLGKVGIGILIFISIFKIADVLYELFF